MNTLRMQNASLLEDSFYRVIALSMRKFCRCHPCDQYNLNILGNLRTMQAVELADVSFNPITHHRRADFTRYRVSYLPSLPCLPDHITHERMVNPFLTLAVNQFKLNFAGEPFASWIPLLARHFRPITSELMSCGKAFAAFCPPTPNYVPPTDRRHARKESMVTLPLDI